MNSNVVEFNIDHRTVKSLIDSQVSLLICQSDIHSDLAKKINSELNPKIQ